MDRNDFVYFIDRFNQINQSNPSIDSFDLDLILIDCISSIFSSYKQTVKHMRTLEQHLTRHENRIIVIFTSKYA